MSVRHSFSESKYHQLQLYEEPKLTTTACLRVIRMSSFTPSCDTSMPNLLDVVLNKLHIRILVVVIVVVILFMLVLRDQLSPEAMYIKSIVITHYLTYKLLIN